MRADIPGGDSVASSGVVAPPATTRRRPWVAGLLNFLLPGLGDVYNGQVKKGIWIFISFYLTVTACLKLMLIIPAPPFNITVPCLIVVVAYLVVIIEAVKTAGQMGDRYQATTYDKWYVYLAALLVNWFIVQPVLAATIRSTVVKAYSFPSGSMKDTLLPGDYVLVDRLAYGLNTPVLEEMERNGDRFIF